MAPYFMMIMIYKKRARNVFGDIYVHVQSPLTHSYPLVKCMYVGIYSPFSLSCVTP